MATTKPRAPAQSPLADASGGPSDALEMGAPGAALATLPGGSTAVALPASFMARLAEEAKDEAAQERPSVSKISLRGGMLSYQQQPVANNILPAVILVAANRNAYYDKPFDPNNLQNPVCFALGENSDDVIMEAHENVPPENVGPNSDEKSRATPRACDGCKFNDWGSDPKGGRGKACKETRRIVVLPGSAMNSVEEAKKAEMAILDIPVTSGKNYSNFVNALAASTKLPPWAVVTNITTERDPKTQFKVLFTPMSIVQSEEIYNALIARREEAVRLALTPYDEVASTEAGKMAAGAGVAAKSVPTKSKF